MKTYLLTNLVTGDAYVGVTTEVKQRLIQHKSRAKKNTHNHLPLYDNINTYGWHNFYAQTLCEGDSEQYMVWLLQPTLNQCWNGRVCPDQVVSATKEANSRKIKCVETGVVYSSLKEASTAVGKPEGRSISQVLRGKNETAYGYHWVYA